MHLPQHQDTHQMFVFDNSGCFYPLDGQPLLLPEVNALL